MTDRPSSPEILRDWSRLPIPVDEPESDRRARIVSHVARTIRETATERARERRTRYAYAIAAAAAVLLLVAGGLFGALGFGGGGDTLAAAGNVTTSSSGVVILRSGKPIVATDASQAVALGDSVSTVADARARLVMMSGVEIDISGGSRALVSDTSATREVVQLEVGEVSVHAPPLGQRSFAIATPDARVVVHGTRFAVKVTKDARGTVTEVSVTEGKVAVHHDGVETFLTPGQSFSTRPVLSEAAPAPKADSTADAPEPAADSPTKPARTAPRTAAVTAKADPSEASALAEQNRLYSAAVAARQRGDDRTALGHLNQLITRYPKSPLVPEARVERFRALKRLGQDAEAAREARRYLVEQGDGAARDEARDVAISPGQPKSQ